MSNLHTEEMFNNSDDIFKIKPLSANEMLKKYSGYSSNSGVEMLEEYAKQEIRIKILECVKIVQNAFNDQNKTLAGRSPEEQNILGNCITVLESDIKNQMKKLI